jgi:adenylate cyclase
MKKDPSSTVESENRRLAAIMFTDIVGFSRQMGADEARTLRLLGLHNEIIQQAVAAHHGQVIKTVGDAFLVDFPSVVNAVQCAQQIQAHLRAHNAEEESGEQIHVRVGIHSGDIVQREGDVFGDGVNIASRLQSLAEPDTICVSDIVYRDVAKKLDLGTVVSLGQPKLKNIAERFQVYALLSESPKGLRQRLQIQQLKLSHRLRPAHWVAVGLVLLVGVITATWYLAHSPLSPQSPALRTEAAPAALPLPDKPSIVVLPFTNMSDDPKQEYFSDGITEDITTDLSRLSSLFVISRNSAFTYKGKATKVQAISREMGVQYVLEGSVQRTDNHMRITAQLIDATNDRHLWAERYDRPLKDIFAVQDEIRQKIVFALKVKLTPEEQERFKQARTNNLEAYDYLLRGLEAFYRTTNEDNLQARQMFEKAIELDSQYGVAYALVAATYYLESLWGWSKDAHTLEDGLAMARRAIALDETLPLGYGILGMIYAAQKQYEHALAESERAIALDPNNADSYQQRAEVLNLTGKPEEALHAVQQAIRLSPRATGGSLINLGLAYFLLGRYTDAISTLNSLLVRYPNWLSAYPLLSLSYVQQWNFQLTQDPQMLGLALAAAQRAVALNNSYVQAHFTLGIVYLFQRQYEQAIAESERAIALDPNVAGGYAALAETLSRVGRSDEALQMAAEALRRKALAPDFHLAFVGSAYYLAGKPAEAIAPLKQYVARYPNTLGPHLNLAAAYSELGKEAEAQAEAAEVLRINPQFSLEVHKQRMPIKDPAVLERQLAALRKAGLK